ncbi:MAG: hypothetical protein EPO21_15595 [Chloroflexota bacterium]|nr:MAG: hypothetical protein EPO21_15595 [Chloroflexota bacterium]
MIRRPQSTGRVSVLSWSRLVRCMLSCVSLLTLLVSSFLAAAPSAKANGAPVTIILTYLTGVSNFGPETATGVAEVIGAEGEITISVTGLPKLVGESYEVWLINTRTKEAYNGGRFNTDDYQSAMYSQVVEGRIPDIHFSLLVLTVANDGVASSGPGERRSIGGYFPVPVADGQQPTELPYTGGETPDAPQLSLDGLVVLPQSVPKTPLSSSLISNGWSPYVLAATGLAILCAVFVAGIRWERRRVPSRARALSDRGFGSAPRKDPTECGGRGGRSRKGH